MKITVTIYDANDDPIDVAAEYTPGRKGTRNRYGVPMDPDDDASIEILDAVNYNGTSVNLNPWELERAMEAVWEAVAESD